MKATHDGRGIHGSMNVSKSSLHCDDDTLTYGAFTMRFALIKEEVLGRFTAANREHYNAQNMVVCFTMSPGLARTWTPIKLKEWINWRDAEDAAGRGMDIRYRVSRSFTLKKCDSDDRHPNRNRTFLNNHNLRGNKREIWGRSRRVSWIISRRNSRDSEFELTQRRRND